MQEILLDHGSHSLVGKKAGTMSGVGVLLNATPEFLAFGRIRIGAFRDSQRCSPLINDFARHRIKEPVCYELQNLVFNMRQVATRMPKGFLRLPERGRLVRLALTGDDARW